MFKPRKLLALTLGTAWLAGCSESGVTDVSPTRSDGQAVPPSARAYAGPAADLGGDWNWTSEEHLTIPDWVAVAIFGIQPEGPTTSARCENSGTMSLDQTDASFTGELFRTTHQCVTRGGQIFQDPAAFAPRAVTDGRIRGRSVRLRLDGPLVECLYHAVISDIQGGVATALDGGGRCIVPGHPQSDVPLDPPPAGTSKTLDWEAVRP